MNMHIWKLCKPVCTHIVIIDLHFGNGTCQAIETRSGGVVHLDIPRRGLLCSSMAGGGGG